MLRHILDFFRGRGSGFSWRTRYTAALIKTAFLRLSVKVSFNCGFTVARRTQNLRPRAFTPTKTRSGLGVGEIGVFGRFWTRMQRTASDERPS